MASRTALLASVKGFRWREVAAALEESPKLLAYRDTRGRNWLHLCCATDPRAGGRKASDSVETADVLLAAGLDIDREAFREGSWKATPLWFAVARGQNQLLARALLERGADPSHCLWAAAFRDDLEMIDRLVAAGAQVDAVAEDETPFLGAVKTSHFTAARRLLEHGANPDFRDPKGMTALHYMLKKSSDLEHFRMLARHGARADIPNTKGETALELLARKRSPGFRKLAQQLAGGRAAR
jgi:hypothetical protein